MTLSNNTTVLSGSTRVLVLLLVASIGSASSSYDVVEDIFLLQTNLESNEIMPSRINTAEPFQTDRKNTLPAASRPAVPKLMHQIWICEGEKACAEPQIDYSESCKAMNPGWAYKRWSADEILELIRTEYSSLLDSYIAYPSVINRADVARYIILHHSGGAYLDMDVECQRPLDVLLKSTSSSVVLTAPAVSRHQGAFGDFRVTNAVMLASPKHSFMASVLQELIDQRVHFSQGVCRGYLFPMRDEIGKACVVGTMGTGPLFLSSAFRDHCKDDPQVARVWFFSEPDGYGTHHAACTWCDTDQRGTPDWKSLAWLYPWIGLALPCLALAYLCSLMGHLFQPGKV